jgi:rhodanese-related sulfurtransferase
MPDRPIGVAALTALELKRRLDQGAPVVVLDVREPDERAHCLIPTPETAVDLHVPMGQVPAEFAAIADASAGRPIVVYCHLGQRSMVVAHWLAARGLKDVFNLDGGVDAWSRDVDRTVPRY